MSAFVRAMAFGATLVTLAVPRASWADAPAPSAAPAAATTTSTELHVRKTPVTLAPSSAGSSFGWKAVGLCAVGALGVLWWKQRSKKALAPKAPTLRILARTSVGVRSELIMVEAHGETLLLGVTPGSITRLGDFSLAADRTEATESEPAPAPVEREPEASVGDRFTALLRGAGVEPPSPRAARKSHPTAEEPKPRTTRPRLEEPRVAALEGQVRGLTVPEDLD